MRFKEEYELFLKEWGQESQERMAIEEMSELIKELCKKIRYEKVDFNELSVTMKIEETEPYEEKISMYEEIIQMDLHHLAVFLYECQSENLTVSEWEEKLRGKDEFYSWK